MKEDFATQLKRARASAIVMTVVQGAPEYLRAASWLWFKRAQ